MITRTIDGVEIRANQDGLVTWMSDWTRCYELVKLGYFTSKFYRNNYGHTDFYIKGEA